MDSGLIAEMADMRKRLAKLEEIYPKLYSLMIKIDMWGESTINTGNEIIRLMGEIRQKNEAMEKCLDGDT